MRSIQTFIKENNNQEDLDDILSNIANSGIEDPSIWDDSGDWDAKDEFEYWEDADNSYDEIVEIIDGIASGKHVVGWCTEQSFTETERYIPRKMFDIMRSGKHSTPYKKYANKMDVWETVENGVTCTLMKFKAYKNKDGKDYIEYWYMLALDK